MKIGSKFTRQDIVGIHTRLDGAMRYFCAAEGLEFSGSRVSYTEQAFDARVSVKVPGALSIKEQRQSYGSARGKDGTSFRVGDAVKFGCLQYTVKGLKQVKAVVLDSAGKEWLIRFDQLVKVVTTPAQVVS